MKALKIVAVAAAFALVMSLAACAAQASFSLEELEYDDGTPGTYLKATAENGAEGTSILGSALTVGEGDVVVLSPVTESGSFHVTITSSDKQAVAYDDDVSGRVMFTIQLAPGTYDVSVAGNNVTGYMTIAAHSAAEIAAQNESLGKALEENGIDPSTVPSPNPEG